MSPRHRPRRSLDVADQGRNLSSRDGAPRFASTMRTHLTETRHARRRQRAQLKAGGAGPNAEARPGVGTQSGPIAHARGCHGPQRIDTPGVVDACEIFSSDERDRSLTALLSPACPQRRYGAGRTWSTPQQSCRQSVGLSPVAGSQGHCCRASDDSTRAAAGRLFDVTFTPRTATVPRCGRSMRRGVRR